jgi:hypothetical protein
MPTNIRRAVRLAVRARLALISGLPPVSYQFQPFTPTLVLYIRESLIFGPGSTSPAELGFGGTKRMRAIYQLDIRAPLQTVGGASVTTTADEWADKICAQFEPGLVLTYDSRRLVIERCASAEHIATPPDWTSLPVSVSLYSEFTSFT